VVTEFQPDVAKFGQVFAEGFEDPTFSDYTTNIVNHLGAQACADELGRIIDWAQAGIDGLTVDSQYRQTFPLGESIYGTLGHGGTGAGTPAPDIYVVTPDVPAPPKEGETTTTSTTAPGGEQPVEIITCPAP
jgi:hypothetical protein